MNALNNPPKSTDHAANTSTAGLARIDAPVRFAARRSVKQVEEGHELASAMAPATAEVFPEWRRLQNSTCKFAETVRPGAV